MSVDIEEITSLGTRVLDRILKPVYDRIAEVAARVETLEHELFDKPKQIQADATKPVSISQSSLSPGSFVLPVTQSASSSTPAAPPVAVVEPDRMSDPPAQVAGDLEAEPDPDEPSAS